MPDLRVLVVTTSANHFPQDPNHRTGVWLEEFTVPYLELGKRGATLTVASPAGGPVPIDPRSAATPEQELEWAEPMAALRNSVKVTDVSADDFEAIFLPGGHGPMFDLPHYAPLKALLTSFDEQGKVISSLCHGPAGLLNAEGADGRPLVADRRITSYTWREEVVAELDKDVPFNLQEALTAEGAVFVEAEPRADHVVVDDRFVTGQNPWSTAQLAARLVEAVVAHSATR